MSSWQNELNKLIKIEPDGAWTLLTQNPILSLFHLCSLFAPVLVQEEEGEEVLRGHRLCAIC